MTFGIRLRTLRRAKELTQQELAEKSDVSRIYIQALESNRRTPSMKLLHRLAEALEVDPADLLEQFPADHTGRLQIEELFNRNTDMQIWYRGHQLSDRDLSLVKRLIEAALTDWDSEER